MTHVDAGLVELAHRFGVATDYTDWTGRMVEVAETTLVAVLAALGVEVDTPEQRTEALQAQDRAYWSKSLPATVVAKAGSDTTFWAHVDNGADAHVWVRLEDGTVRTGLRQLDNFTAPYDLDGRMIGEATFALPADLPLGYHRVHLRSGSAETSTALIVTPPWLGMPARLGNQRTWGMATQLYSVRSTHSWGVGDLADLADLAVWSGAQHGAG
ncbi:MAG: 4-alpha-glucanotransferase, partial [Mycobacterium sp.]|nr:4-alpha-glucanotransferase [Mycobacterium sp.]